MKAFQIFTDRRGRKWVCGKTAQMLFGIVEPCKKYFWNYNWLCKVSAQKAAQKWKAHGSASKSKQTKHSGGTPKI